MRKELETIALIENYLGDKLSPEDQLQFEAEMAINEELREEVELQRDLVGAILLAAFADDVKHVHAELVAKPSHTLGKLIWYSLSGVLLIAGLTSAMMLWNKTEKQSTDLKAAPQLAVSGNPTIEKQVENKAAKATPPGRNKNVRAGKKSHATNSRQQAAPFDPDRHRATANLQNFLPSFRNVTMNPNEDFTFKMTESQSTVFIPANSMRNSAGKTVTGPVEIRYREYRDAADMAFSKIPMTVHENGEELAFNSAGMFEIFAYQNGEKLSLDPDKPMIVDYNVTQRLDNLYFWQLKEDRWVKLRVIDSTSYTSVVMETVQGAETGERFASTITSQSKIKLDIRKTFGGKTPKNVRVKHLKGMKWVNVTLQYTDSGYVFDASGENYKVYAQGMKTLKIKDLKRNTGQMTALDVWLQPKRRKGFAGKIEKRTESAQRKDNMKIKGHYTQDTVYDFPIQVPDSSGLGSVKRRKGYYKQDTVYAMPLQLLSESTDKSVVFMPAQTNTDAAREYSKLVSGLQCPDFGVYNCDQTYRIAEKVAITGKFQDEHGKSVDADGMLSVIAAGVNGAISYSPQSFVCSKAGTTLLLFCRDQQIYALSKEEFAEMNILNDGDYTFQVRNMTAELTDANDLRRYLGLKEK